MSVDAILKEIELLTIAERNEFRKRFEQQFPRTEEGSETSPGLAKLLDERVPVADANPDAGYTMEEVIEYMKRKK